jgi:hypothetical protein
MLAYWDDTLACMLSFCAALGTLKFIRLLEFNRSILTLINAFRIGFASTAAFLAVFALATFAWLQFAYVIFGQRVHDFSTFIKTLETGFLLVLGKFQLTEMMEANVFYAIGFHITFNFFVVFIMFNLFITTLCDALDSAKEEEQLSEYMNMEAFIMKRVKSIYYSIFRKSKYKMTDHEMKMEQSLLKSGNYVDEMTNFVSKFNQVISKIETFNQISFKENTTQPK